MKRVLAAASDEHIRQEIGAMLSGEDIDLLFAHDSESCIVNLYAHRPQLVIVHTPVTGIAASALCRLIRESGISTSIIFLSSVPDVLDAVLLLELGADDVIFRPLNEREFRARVRANMRRSWAGSALPTLRFGNVEIDFERRSVSRNGRLLDFTRSEYNLLAVSSGTRGKRSRETQPWKYGGTISVPLPAQ